MYPDLDLLLKIKVKYEKNNNRLKNFLIFKKNIYYKLTETNNICYVSKFLLFHNFFSLEELPF